MLTFLLELFVYITNFARRQRREHKSLAYHPGTGIERPGGRRYEPGGHGTGNDIKQGALVGWREKKRYPTQVEER